MATTIPRVLEQLIDRHWNSRVAPIAWRRMRTVAIVFFACLGVLALMQRFVENRLIAVDDTSIRSMESFIKQSRIIFLGSLGAVFSMSVPPVWFWIAEVLTKKRARSFQGRMCGNCLHDLRGLGDAGKCPECGHPFSLDQLRRYWKGVDTPPTS